MELNNLVFNEARVRLFYGKINQLSKNTELGTWLYTGSQPLFREAADCTFSGMTMDRTEPQQIQPRNTFPTKYMMLASTEAQ
jgi:hypothetical protein